MTVASPARHDPFSATWREAGHRMALTERRLVRRDDDHHTGGYRWLESLDRKISKHILAVSE